MTVSRRDFLKSAGVTSLATAVTTATVAEAQTGPPAVGPGDVPVTLMVMSALEVTLPVPALACTPLCTVASTSAPPLVPSSADTVSSPEYPPATG